MGCVVLKYCLLPLIGLLLIGCSGDDEKAEVIYARKPTPYHTIKAGETVQSVASEYGMTVQEFIEINALITPYELIPGQRVIVHSKPKTSRKNVFESDGISVMNQDVTPETKLDPSGFTKTQTPKDQETINKDGEETAFKDDESLKNKAEQQEDDHQAADESKHAYAWPVKGKVVRKFGEKAGTEVSEGISISAPEGTPVYAAAEGTVLKSNVEIKGFGKAIVIEHADGKKTVYLHLKVCNAKTGQKVDQKTIIGRVGKTGGLKKPQLHFQVRGNGKKAIDPLIVLK